MAKKNKALEPEIESVIKKEFLICGDVSLETGSKIEIEIEIEKSLPFTTQHKKFDKFKLEGN